MHHLIFTGGMEVGVGLFFFTHQINYCFVLFYFGFLSQWWVNFFSSKNNHFSTRFWGRVELFSLLSLVAKYSCFVLFCFILFFTYQVFFFFFSFLNSGLKLLLLLFSKNSYASLQISNGAPLKNHKLKTP